MIEKLPSGKWRVRLYAGAQYVGSRTFERKRDAAEWEMRQQTMLRLGTWVHPDDAAMPYGQWLDEWLATRGGAQLTIRKREWAAERARAELGRVPLSSVTPLKVEQAIAAIRDDVSVHTAYQVLVVLRQSLGAAMREGLIARDPTAGITLPKLKGNEPRPLTHRQLWRLADAAVCEADRLMFLTMGYSGARWGEISALRPSQVSERGLRLTHAYAEVSGTLVLGDLKDHESRTVPLPTLVLSELMPWARKQLKAKRRHLFGTSKDTGYRNGNWRRSVLNPALARAELPAITPHNFRDTAASLAIEAGASVIAVSRMLGHESAATTLRHYAAMFPDSFDGLVIRLDDAISEALDDQEMPGTSGGERDEAVG